MTLSHTNDNQPWKWVSANGLIHIHCDDLIEIAGKL